MQFAETLKNNPTMRSTGSLAGARPRGGSDDDGRTKFGTAIIDPPWPYRAPRETADGSKSGQTGYSSHHYKPLTIADLAELPVGRHVTDIVLLWTTGPMLPAAARLVAAWGFDWVTVIYWVKTSRTGLRHGLWNGDREVSYRPHWGVGYWFRGDVEPVVIAKRRGTPSYRTGERASFLAPVRRHSAKPPFLHDLAERHFPGPYLELFARDHRPGWTCIGHDLGQTDIHETMAHL